MGLLLSFAFLCLLLPLAHTQLSSFSDFSSSSASSSINKRQDTNEVSSAGRGGGVAAKSIITGDLSRFRPPPYFDERLCSFDLFKQGLVVNWFRPEVQKAQFLFAKDVQKVKDPGVFCFLLGMWMAQMQTYFSPLVCEEPNSWCSVPPELEDFYVNQKGHLRIKVKTDKKTGEVERVSVKLKVRPAKVKTSTKKPKKNGKTPKPLFHQHLKVRQVRPNTAGNTNTNTNTNYYSSLPPDLTQQIRQLDSSGRESVELAEVDLTGAPQCSSLYCFKNPNELCRSADRLARCKLDSPCGTSCLRLNFNESDPVSVERHGLRVLFRMMPNYLDVLVSVKPELAVFLKKVSNSSSFMEFSSKAKQNPQSLRIAENTMMQLFDVSRFNTKRHDHDHHEDVNSPLHSSHSLRSPNETLMSSSSSSSSLRAEKMFSRQSGSVECEDCGCVPNITPSCAFCFRADADGASCWDDSVDNEPSCCQCLVIFR